MRLREVASASQGWQVSSLAEPDGRAPEPRPSVNLDTLLTGAPCTNVCQLYPPGWQDPPNHSQGLSLPLVSSQ